MNVQQFSTELEIRLTTLENETAAGTGTPPGAPTFDAYRERLGIVQGLIMARQILEQLNDDVRKG